MAQILAPTNVLALPNGSDFANQANPCPSQGIGVNKIQNMRAANAGEVASYPGATVAIEVVYNNMQQQYTGAYIVGVQSLSTLVTAANA